MERKDFKEITDEHFKTCEKLIKNNGVCWGIYCGACPFTYANNVNCCGCVDNRYRVWSAVSTVKDETLIENAKEFLKFKNNKKEDCSMNNRLDVQFKDINRAYNYTEENDVVNKPNHYQLKVNGMDIEVKDLIKAIVKNMNGTKAYYVGNIIKYIMRAEKKNGIEDYKKARKYLDFIIGEIGE